MRHWSENWCPGYLEHALCSSEIHLAAAKSLEIIGHVTNCCKRPISARSTGMNSRNTTKMVEHKFVLFATFEAFWTLVTLLIISLKLIRILLKGKYIQDQTYATLLASML